jgi:hypothetical protein
MTFPVGISHVQLRPWREIARFLEDVNAVRAQVLERHPIAAHAQGEMAVAIVDVVRAAQRARWRMLDQMELPPFRELVPRAAEWEWCRATSFIPNTTP